MTTRPPFSVVICDPPWTFKPYSAKGGKKAPKYDVMTEQQLIELAPTVANVVGRNSVMMMWGTLSTLEINLRVLRAWGFKYKSARVWRKSTVGTGYWARCDAEVLLIGTRGRVRLPAGAKGRSIFEGERVERRHSSKPAYVHQWCERGYATERKIELFARQSRQGWECIGSDLGTRITPEGLLPCRPPTKSSTPYEKLSQPMPEATA